MSPLGPPVTALSLPSETIFRRSGIEHDPRKIYDRFEADEEEATVDESSPSTPKRRARKERARGKEPPTRDQEEIGESL